MFGYLDPEGKATSRGLRNQYTEGSVLLPVSLHGDLQQCGLGQVLLSLALGPSGISSTNPSKDAKPRYPNVEYLPKTMTKVTNMETLHTLSLGPLDP